MAWCLTGLAAVVYFAGADDVDPDRVYGAMAAEFLPQILPGLLGLFLAALLASVMSSCDSFMIASSALITENIYKRAAPGKPDKHYMTVGRIVALAVVAGGVIYAFLLEDVIQGIEIFWRISAMTGVAFWLGLFWRRTTTAGAWASTLTAFAVMFAVSSSQGLLQWLDGTALDQATNMIRPAEDGAALEMWLPWQMLWYLSAGTVAGIVVSLVTPRVSEQRLERYYALVRTPVHKAEPETDEVCTLGEGVEPAPAKKLIPLKDFEIYVPSVVSVVGFLVAWALVGAMIGAFYWVTQ
jgi:Na+/proline symporter